MSTHAQMMDEMEPTIYELKGRKAWGASKEKLVRIQNPEMDEGMISPLQSSRSRRTWKPKWIPADCSIKMQII